jgi:type II secretion system protein C
MVKQQLWIINSGLIALAMIGIASIPLIDQELPAVQSRRRTTVSLEAKQPRLLVSPEKIYQNDLFDTFTPPAEPQPTAKNLVTPIPQLNIQSTKNPIKNQKVEFIPPLDITIKGIIMSQDPQSSIVMAADNTGKEQMYHIGDKINDGQVLKITKNQILIIRSNGQQETFFLRKVDKLSPGLSSWDTAIHKVDEMLYHIDPVEIIKELTSIGEVIEALDICGAYKNNSSIGLRIGSIKHHPLGEKLGLKSGDVITKINNLPVNDSKERIAVYDAIAALPMGGYIHVTLLRDGTQVELSYLLKRLERPSPFSPQNQPKNESEKAPGDDLFKLSKDSQRQHNRRRFEQAHRTQEQHQTAVSEMRKKMLDEMKTRAPKRRVL